MSRFIVSIFVIFLFGKVQHSAGYKWIAVKTGDPLPNDTVILDRSLNTYVGRAQHFNSLLPAEVYNGSYARIYTCSKEIIKHQFEVLVASESCTWQRFHGNYDEISENIVRAGNYWNGEPIFIGKAASQQVNSYQYNNDIERIASIFLTTSSFASWKERNYNNVQYTLICDDQNKWIDTSAVKIPNNTISGGKSQDDKEIFVARLLKGCDIIGGQVIPELGISTALDLNGYQMQSLLCQVLVGDPNAYIWVEASDGEIPDYAVVVSKINNELQYVSRTNNVLGYIAYNKLGRDMDYEILVRNVE